MKNEIIVLGNGILAMSIAYGLKKKSPNVSVTIVGRKSRFGCASLAAAAMLNSLAELEKKSLEHPVDLMRFKESRKANDMWENFSEEIDSEKKNFVKWGTFIINNTASDGLDDENFDAICDYLDQFGEKYERVAPSEISGYNPEPRQRATRCIFVPKEGFVHPTGFFNLLEEKIIKLGVNFIDAEIEKLNVENHLITSVIASGKVLKADLFILANGADMSKFINHDLKELNILPVLYGVGCSLLLEHNMLNAFEYVIRTPNRGLACGIYHAPNNSDRVVVGASNLITDNPEMAGRATSVYTLLKGAMEQINLQHFKSRLLNVNFGYRPTTLDTYPIVGWTEYNNLYIAGGTKRDGYHFAPYFASIVVDDILFRKTNDFLDTFKPNRKPILTLTKADSKTKFLKHSISALYQHDFQSSKGPLIDDIISAKSAKFEQLYASLQLTDDAGLPVELIDYYIYKNQIV